MDLYIPKIKEIYIRDGEISYGTQIQGLYRAVLRGPDGRIKYDSGTKQNMILDQGLYKLIRAINDTAYMALGTSDVANVETMVGLQGSFLGQAGQGYGYAVGTGAPLYGGGVTIPTVFVAGNGTGTIKEAILMNQSGDPLADATVRFVLDTPIVKGAQDELSIEHTMIVYPDVNDSSGTITMTGDVPQDYDWVARPFGVSFLYGYDSAYSPLYAIKSGGAILRMGNAVPPDNLIGITDTVPPGGGSMQGHSYSYGGTLPTYYYQQNQHATVDQIIGSWNSFNTYHISVYYQAVWQSKGIQWSFMKAGTTDPFEKANTHVFDISWRNYLSRFAP